MFTTFQYKSTNTFNSMESKIEIDYTNISSHGEPPFSFNFTHSSTMMKEEFLFFVTCCYRNTNQYTDKVWACNLKISPNNPW